jgi:hypothetical protein
MVITIDDYQTDVLREVLASALTQLRIESSRTDSHDFRVALHDRERIVEALLGKLPPEPRVGNPL